MYDYIVKHQRAYENGEASHFEYGNFASTMDTLGAFENAEELKEYYIVKEDEQK